jgi:hypothetical protein
LAGVDIDGLHYHFHYYASREQQSRVYSLRASFTPFPRVSVVQVDHCKGS